MRRATFNQYIKEIDFKGLFITEMGWNRFHGQVDIQPIEIDGTEYRMKTIAERNGFQIIICPVNTIPTTSVCRKIDFKLRKNGVTPVFKSGSFWCVAVCTQEEKDGFAPLENVEAFIDEELLSRRCGAAFDKILKREISKKNIKYRR